MLKEKLTINQKINFVFAILIAMFPIIASIFDIRIIEYSLVWVVGYIIYLVASLFYHRIKNIKYNLKIEKNPITICVALMIAWAVIALLVNACLNIYVFFYVFLFLVFLSFYRLDKKKLKFAIKLLIITTAISCVMGFIDSKNEFMPGFRSQYYPMSLHFVNPNYTSSIVSVFTILCFCFLNKQNKTSEKFLLLICYLIFATHLFMNGSFTPLTAVFIVEIFVIVFLKIKTKKIDKLKISLLLVLIPICLLVDLIPNIADIRTCDYNYFLECVAFFDNVFNTNILKCFGIESIQGADGWDRDVLLKQSLKQCVGSTKAFLFGAGAGTTNEFRPHEPLVSLWLDFGIITPILFVAFFVLLFTKTIKLKFNIKRFYLSSLVIVFLLSSIISSVLFYSYYMLMIFLAVLIKNIKEEETSTQTVLKEDVQTNLKTEPTS